MLTGLQINNLITGTPLAAELPAPSPGLRHFVTISGYELDKMGKSRRLSKYVDSNKIQSAFFQIRDYKIKAIYLENGWDVTEDDCIDYIYVAGLKGIESAEIELSKHLEDFSLLVPEWRCENPI